MNNSHAYKHDYASLIEKIKNKVWNAFNPPSGTKGRRYWCYPAWYHWLNYRKQMKDKTGKELQRCCGDDPEELRYLTQEPHRGSGIGVALEGILSGEQAANYWKLNYAYSSLPIASLDHYLGIGDTLAHADQLCAIGYRKVRLPYYNLKNASEMQMIQEIIDSYAGEKVVFYQEVLQPFMQGKVEEVRSELLKRFTHSKARINDPPKYDSQMVNIAVHIRRGDVGEDHPKAGMEEWWIDLSYYVTILQWLRKQYAGREPDLRLYIISEGTREQFQELEQLEIPCQFILNAEILDSWMYMIQSDILLTGASSFSYHPALFQKGLKISPICRFHYPQADDWIVAERDGSLEQGAEDKLQQFLKHKNL